jgi:iron complex transport system ATP-binding protein
MLSTRGLGVRIGERWILRDLTLDLRPGETTVVVGPNGAGKSTLMAVLAGERAPSLGVVAFAGRPIGARSPAVLARRRAVLPQSSSLQFHFTVEEVVGLGRNPFHGTADAAYDHGIVHAAMVEAAVAELRDRLVPTLSGGESQRVHLARCLAQLGGPMDDRGPKALLLDEPTANLDPIAADAVWHAVNDAASSGIAVVVATHDLRAAETICDRVALLDGRVLHVHESRHGRAAPAPSPLLDVYRAHVGAR